MTNLTHNEKHVLLISIMGMNVEFTKQFSVRFLVRFKYSETQNKQNLYSLIGQELKTAFLRLCLATYFQQSKFIAEKYHARH